MVTTTLSSEARTLIPVGWVEEELILSLPAFPQHPACEPDREKLQTKETGETQQKTNPLAVLASLKRR